MHVQVVGRVEFRRESPWRDVATHPDMNALEIRQPHAALVGLMVVGWADHSPVGRERLLVAGLDGRERLLRRRAPRNRWTKPAAASEMVDRPVWVDS